MADKVGAWTAPTDEDIEKIQKICDQVKSKVENMTNKTYVEYRAVLYITQLVNGDNYVIKVFCGVDDYIHLSLFQELPCSGGKVAIHHVEQQRTKEDTLTPF